LRFKILSSRNVLFTHSVNYLLILLLTIGCAVAKSSPKIQQPQALVFKRAQSLNNGISISWLEQTWLNKPSDKGGLKKADFELLKKLGFKSIRLPVAFTWFEARHISTEQAFLYIDKVVKQCHTYGFKLIIDYHYGKLNDATYLTETPKIIDTWLKMTKRYKHESPDDVFFEL
jgi:endoglucanase